MYFAHRSPFLGLHLKKVNEHMAFDNHNVHWLTGSHVTKPRARRHLIGSRWLIMKYNYILVTQLPVSVEISQQHFHVYLVNDKIYDQTH